MFKGFREIMPILGSSLVMALLVLMALIFFGVIFLLLVFFLKEKIEEVRGPKISFGKIIKPVIIIIFLFADFLFLYYSVAFLIQEERVKIDEYREKRIAEMMGGRTDVSSLVECLNAKQIVFNTGWAEDCRKNELKPGCELPDYSRDKFLEFINYCFKVYSKVF